MPPRRARHNTLALTTLCTAAALALAACGGGDGGDGGTTAGAAPGGSAPAGAQTSAPGGGQAGSAAPASPTAATTTAGACYTISGPAPAAAPGSGISLLPARGSAISNYRVLEEPRSAGLCYANYRREQVGLPPLAARDPLHAAAQAHTDYMLANATLTHDESSGNPGYTGATADERIQAAYPTDATAEVVAGASRWTSVANAQLSMSPKDALVSDLVDAPFHRAALLGSYGSAGSGFAERVGANGSGTSASYYQTVDLADRVNGGSDNQMVAYPFDGQNDVPVNWVNTESPNPAPGYENRTMGYPVSLQAINTSLQFEADNFVITDAQGGNVDCIKVDSRSSGLSSAARGVAVCTPVAPLASQQRYSVRVSGRLGAQPMDLGWSFTTR
ncbi:CAP domain-containing protein [Cupriavidus taiwanensis]|uniref:Putative lipoprotein n=1 Tax=Cupriavidus taiwanensis TaxID=164546 RepID=A0A375IDP2_9BURK|nr:CAP domain-containing protein [Cupriavidus taiwanensis]SOY56440.1 putative lipoprotein [Cupriavidus taiwanensis]SOY57115.1 putative lipoprotein [Cupriavidus taiwanensis]SOY79200.1 putative lipoprotein [Cupriavidus taiwanensis]SOZ26023.1 putative lipoprotein [Cupriavidus taiwanensis]SOZ64604.1 putative lipoprotein [Cupriavidus taiwanensis]